MFGTRHAPYVPMQPYQLGLPGIDCSVLPAGERLAPFVHYYWTIAIDGSSTLLPIVPDNAVDLVFRPGTRDDVQLFFPIEKRFDLRLEGPVRYVGACLRLDRLEHAFGLEPQALRRLAPGEETRDRLELGSLLAELGEDETRPQAIIASLDTYFETRRSKGDDSSTGTRLDAGLDTKAEPTLLERFTDASEPESIGAIAGHAGLSERQLRRETRRLFGLGPKRLQRIVRLQRALVELIDGAPRRTDFHDDAHRIREMRALAGWTPGEIRRMADIYNTQRDDAGKLVPFNPAEK